MSPIKARQIALNFILTVEAPNAYRRLGTVYNVVLAGEVLAHWLLHGLVADLKPKCQAFGEEGTLTDTGGTADREPA